MKIPETSANVGAYYGNEENGQWQPNGVIVDSGVGGGVVGSGDAGAHHTELYPVHIRHPHIPGYVMAGAYYPAGYPAPPPAAVADDFEDYMWMENEEEFDKQVMQQLEEEALMEQCIEAMLEDEQRERLQRPTANGHGATTSNGVSSLSLEETVSRSTLNPLAAEFVPTTVRIPSTTQQNTSPTTESPSEESKSEESTADSSEASSITTHESKEAAPPQTDPPEVSAADVQPIATDAHKQTDKLTDTKTKAPPAKKPLKTEVKPAKEVKTKKSTPVKVESKPTTKRKEVRSVQSEETPEDNSTSEPQQPPPPVESPPAAEEPSPGFKPINYAAAAKANKPRKPNEKTPPPSIADKPAVKATAAKPAGKVTADKPAVKATGDKTAVKATGDKSGSDKKPAPKPAKTAEKVVQRKNSMK